MKKLRLSTEEAQAERDLLKARVAGLKAEVAELKREAEVVKSGRLTQKQRDAILACIEDSKRHDERGEDLQRPDNLITNSPAIIAVYEFLGMQAQADERRKLVSDARLERDRWIWEQREQKLEEGE